MSSPEVFAEIWRGSILESVHLGHAVVCDASGDIVEAWGNPNQIILPRSSCKMVQALPLIESGAAKAAGVSAEELALACASHNGAAIHTDRVAKWLDRIGLSESDLRCGAHPPTGVPARDRLIRAGESPCQLHNNCSGKHAGFLSYAKHVGAGPEYVDLDHPLQKAVRESFEELTGMDSPGHGIDGCSAPNFATSVHGLARAMAFFAAASEDGTTREAAAHQLVRAMIAHPDLVAGEDRACTELMRAMDGKAAIKTGADGVYIGILPEQKLGIALKIVDGATRASECAIAALLVRLGVLAADHPATRKRMNHRVTNWRGLETGSILPGKALLS